MLWELMLRWRVDPLVSIYTLHPEPLSATHQGHSWSYSPHVSLAFQVCFSTVTWQSSVFIHLFWSIKNVVQSNFLWLSLRISWIFNSFVNLESILWNSTQLEYGSTRIYQCCCSLCQSLMGCFCNSAIFIFLMSSVQCKVSKIRNNPSLGICFDAKWNLPFLKTTSFGSISEIGCPLLVVSVTPLFTAHSHLLPLCWTCQSFW